MKPIIIYLDKDDEIKLTKKEFEQYIKDAYNQGYDCGYTEGKKSNFWNPYWYGGLTYNQTNTNPPTITTTPNEPKKGLDITWTSTDVLSGEILNTLGDK